VSARHLESLGKPIGPYDLRVAAIALANGCAAMTHNTDCMNPKRSVSCTMEIKNNLIPLET
jgi:predicted nucleic acid-binding protein